MNITLVNPKAPRPTFDSSFAQFPPLGLLYIAATLEKYGHTVTVIDAELFCYGFQEVVERIPEQTEFVIIGGESFQAQEAFAIAALLRKQRPACVIVYEGIYACALAYEAFALCSAIDYVILGPGDAPVLELVNGKASESIAGCLSRGQQPAALPIFAEPLPFSEQPLPARHLVPIWAYTGGGHLPFMQTSIMLTRSVISQCTFCSSTSCGIPCGVKSEKRNVEDIVAELRWLRAAGFAEIFFQDDSVNANSDWAQELFSAIKKADLSLRYKLCLHANEKILPESLLVSMAEAGVDHIFSRIESAQSSTHNDTPDTPEGPTRDDVRRAVALAKKYNINTTLDFIVGLPNETEATIAESIAFVKELQPYEANFSIATPLPGSPLRKWAKENGFLEEVSLEALCPWKAAMRIEALTGHDIELLCHKAKHETLPFTTCSANTAESQCDHLTAVLLDFERRPETASAVSFVKLVLARASLDIDVGEEPCFWQAQRLLGTELSAYHRAKAQALLGHASVLFGQPELSTQLFYAAECAGFPEISAWCCEKYASLGYGTSSLLFQHDTKPTLAPVLAPTLPQNIASFALALQQPGEAPAELFILGLPEGKSTDEELASTAHQAFSSLEELLNALGKQTSGKERRIVWINGVFSRSATEGDIFAMLRSFHASGSDALWVFCDNFGSLFGDSIRNQPKHISRNRALELADMAGFKDVTGVEAYLIAVRALFCGQSIDLPRLLVLRNSMLEVEHKQYVLDAQQKMQKCLATVEAESVSLFREDMASLVADATYHLLLRYACATFFDLEDELYAESRTIDYGLFGQWQLDYANMVMGACDLFGEKLLDFGCAYGAHLLGFRMVGIDACGVDVNKSFIQDGLPLIAGKLKHFPCTNPAALLDMFPSRSLTTIISTEVFEHVPHQAKEEYAKLFAQMLAPGGSCIITCPTGEQTFENLHGNGVFADPQHAYLMTDTQLCELFTSAGFEDVSDEYRAHIRAFSGGNGFSFWRTYCSYDKYFCFRMPGKRPCKSLARKVKGHIISAHTRFGYATMSWRWITTCKLWAKQSTRAVNFVAVKILPEQLKERMKASSLGSKIRSYLRR